MPIALLLTEIDREVSYDLGERDDWSKEMSDEGEVDKGLLAGLVGLQAFQCVIICSMFVPIYEVLRSGLQWVVFHG